MFRITQLPQISFWCLSTPGPWVVADPVAVVLSPGSRALDLESWLCLLLWSWIISPGWISSWIHLLIIDTCISKHLDYLCCKCIIFSIYTRHLLHVCPSWERDPSSVALPEVSPIFFPLKLWGFSFFWKFFLVRCEGLRTEGVVLSTDILYKLWSPLRQM
jgi:hypothetical protein